MRPRALVPSFLLLLVTASAVLAQRPSDRLVLAD